MKGRFKFLVYGIVLFCFSVWVVYTIIKIDNLRDDTRLLTQYISLVDHFEKFVHTSQVILIERNIFPTDSLLHQDYQRIYNFYLKRIKPRQQIVQDEQYRIESIYRKIDNLLHELDATLLTGKDSSLDRNQVFHLLEQINLQIVALEEIVKKGLHQNSAALANSWFTISIIALFGVIGALVLLFLFRNYQVRLRELDQADKLLKRSLNQLKTVLDNIPGAAFLKDRSGRYRLVNQQFCKLVGRPLEIVVGSDDEDLFGPESARRIRREDEQIFASLTPFSVEHQSKTNGRIFSITKVPIIEPDGDAQYLVGMLFDITELKQLQQRIQANEQNLRQQNEALLELSLSREIIEGEFHPALQKISEIAARTLKATFSSFWHFVPDQRQFLCSGVYGSQSEKLDGHANFYLPEDLLKEITRSPNRVVVVDKHHFTQIWNDIRMVHPQFGQTHSLLVCLIRRAEKIIGLVCFHFSDAEYHGAPENLQFAGSLADFVHLVLEARERNEIKQQLRESEERYRAMFEGIPIGIYRSTPSGKILEANPAFLQMLGIESVEKLQKINARSLYVHPVDRDRWKLIMDQLGVVRSFETQLKRSDGYTIWVRENARAIRDKDGQIIYYEGSIENVTHRKLVEEALIESEERYRDLVENVDDLIFTHDLKGKLLSINRVVLKKFGLATLEEVVGKSIRTFVPPKKRKLVKTYLQEIKERGYAEGLMKVVTPNGKEHILDFHCSLKKVDGKPMVVRGVAHDVTELIKTQKALAQEKERLAVTLRSIGDGVITTDIEGHVVLINRRAEEITGWKQEEAVGKSLTEVFSIFHPKTGESFANPVQQVLRTGQPVDLPAGTILRKRDGSQCIIADSAAPIRNQRSEIIGVVLVFRDITHQQRLEAEVQKAQRLESLGVLAGGIAHDFNNILTAILGNLSLARMTAPPDQPIIRRLTEAEKACERAKDLTQQLLTFAKGGVPIKKAARIEDIIVETANFVLHGSSVRAVFQFPPNLWAVEVDEGQMSQVINNLVINAVQAMPTGGKITITGENILIENGGYSAQNLLPPGKYVKISISDEGTGIPPEHLPHIFDPYFTTKQRGSGLGLASSYSIIKKHGGDIQVESQVGKGTTFTIYLPAISKKIRPDRHQPVDIKKGSGKILIMDDEPEVLEVAGEILDYLGYQADFAPDGDKAIEMYKKALQKGSPYQLVIMDLTIRGGKGGKETIQELQRLDSDVLAVVASGYSNDPILANFEEYGFKGRVAKPFTIKELGEVLTRLLRERKKKKIQDKKLQKKVGVHESYKN